MRNRSEEDMEVMKAVGLALTAGFIMYKLQILPRIMNWALQGKIKGILK